MYLAYDWWDWIALLGVYLECLPHDLLGLAGFIYLSIVEAAEHFTYSIPPIVPRLFICHYNNDLAGSVISQRQMHTILNLVKQHNMARRRADS